MSETNCVAVVYETRSDAEAAVRDLRRAAFDLTKLSVLGKESPTEGQTVELEGSGDWAARPLDSLQESLGDVALLPMPGIGSILVAGALKSKVAELDDSGGGSSALESVLSSAGLPNGCVPHYESELKADRFLIVARGTADEVMQARAIMRATRPAEISVHFDSEDVGVGAL